MPLYEYRCTDCEQRFDAFAPVARADEASCPACGAGARRLLSVFSAPRGAQPGAVAARGGDGASAGGCCGGGCGHC